MRIPNRILEHPIEAVIASLLLLALLFVRPFLTEERLNYILAFVGGIMVRGRGRGEGVCM